MKPHCAYSYDRTVPGHGIRNYEYCQEKPTVIVDGHSFCALHGVLDNYDVNVMAWYE